jgi:hypothetical protein
MKNIRHHAIIITAKDCETLELIRKEVMYLFDEYMEAKTGYQLVSPIVRGLINKYCSFFVAPDGSIEGYDASHDADMVREKIIEFLNSVVKPDESNCISFVEVSYGSFGNTAEVLNHN